MPKQSIVILSDEQREALYAIINTGTRNARSIHRARVLLLSADGQTDASIADTLEIHAVTVANIRHRFCRAGIDRALYDAPRSGQPAKFSADDQARVTAIACSQAPEGRSRWTLRLLADRIVELELAEHVCAATVRSVLKKTRSSRT